MIAALLTYGSSLLTGLSGKLYAVLGAAAVVAALWVWIGGLRADLAELREEKAALRRRVSVQQAELAQRDQALQAFIAAQRKADALRLATSQAREEAIHAPQSQDGPLAPVLRRALERLR